MEFVDGPSIDEIYKKKGPFLLYRVKKYTRQILEALEFAHHRKVIHRDIKGKNILISKDDNVKLTDFGSAKLCDSTLCLNQNKFAASMNYQYTPLYTAPEVLHNSGYCEKIDIWSVGCVIIEMGTAKLPWSECNFENVFSALYHIGQPDKYPKWPANLNGLCQDFLRLCLNRDAAKRCNASELLRHRFLLASPTTCISY